MQKVYDSHREKGDLLLHPGRVEPASPREKHGAVSWAAPSPGVAAFISFVAQAKPVRFESAGASALHTPTFGFNPGDASDGSLIDRSVLITPPFVGPFCRSVGAQSATQPWRADPLTS